MLAAILVVTAFTGQGSGLTWPLNPDSALHRIGNSYGQYQDYGIGQAFMHTGIDIMVAPGTPVYACEAGYVRKILTTGAYTHWRVVVVDTIMEQETDGLMYAHLDSASMYDEAGLVIGQYVEQGQFLGRIVDFPYPEPEGNFDHIHFSKVRCESWMWNYFQFWEYIGDPSDDLDCSADTIPPVFENASATQRFAFCLNQSDSYFEEGSTVSGDVDIIARIYDIYNDPEWRVAPHTIEYCIDGDSSLPWTNSVCFSAELGTYDSEAQVAVHSIYQNDSICDTEGDYYSRVYYFAVTNTDGDSLIETSDAQKCWSTPYFHNGVYRVYVRAGDPAGNWTLDSMAVTIANYFSLQGTITLAGLAPDHSGSIVALVPAAIADTTGAEGDFMLTAVGGGNQTISVSHVGYASLDTALVMYRNQTLTATLTPVYTCGDVDRNDIVNVSDAVYLISYIFDGGPPPLPPEAADVDCNQIVNISDGVYLISYIFGGGPEPCAGCSTKG